MSEKNDAVAESIIKCEGLIFAVALRFGDDGELKEARRLLKKRLIEELNAAEARGVVAGVNATSGGRVNAAPPSEDK